MKINSTLTLTFLLLILLSVSAFAQSDSTEPVSIPAIAATELPDSGKSVSTQPQGTFSRMGIFSLELSFGGFGPRGELRQSGLFENAFAFGINGGLTPPKARQLQIDFGADFAFQGLTGRRSIPIGPGLGIKVNDSQIFPYAGARVYLTPRRSKVQVSAGGGGAFGTYNEYINTGDEYTPSLDCTVCESRWGTGGYAMGQVRYRFENGLGLGLTTKYYSIRTSGFGFSNVLGRRSSDQWLGLMLTVSFN